MNPGQTIQIEHISKTYDDNSGYLRVLDDIHTCIHSREFLCVLGPSGCGKTTFLRILSGLESATHGRVIYPGGKSPRIGLVFQESSLMPWRSVLENILLPLELRGVDSQLAREQALELADLVGLKDFTNAWPSSLSGGMAQRVAIARAVIQDPDLLLLDEPFGSLDALTREQMGVELLRVWQARRKTVVMVTHSISEALMLADRILVFSYGPARIELDLTVDLPRPRMIEMRYSRKFQQLARQLRAAISRSKKPLSPPMN
ncbi:MAG: ABC transporter ATP-binding protein [Anaerolineaceae bacterium]|nr:ABC transporter ATP-binding protein [Anaerolineaceae bacterium]